MSRDGSDLSSLELFRAIFDVSSNSADLPALNNCLLGAAAVKRVCAVHVRFDEMIAGPGLLLLKAVLNIGFPGHVSRDYALFSRDRW